MKIITRGVFLRTSITEDLELPVIGEEGAHK